MYTLNDAIRECELFDAEMFHRHDKAAAAHSEALEILQANPHIGQLMVNGKAVYYVGAERSLNIKNLI